MLLPSPERPALPTLASRARELALRLRSVKPPRGWGDALLQLALWGLADLLYEGVRGIVVGERSIALANGRAVIHLEQSLGVFHEATVQGWVVHSAFVMNVSNYVYGNAQFVVNLLFLMFVYFFRNEVFYFVRNMFFIAMGIALVVHLAVPVAPPRMFPQYGFVDTIQQFAHIDQDKGAISLFVNPYAAVPSMHICFGMLVGATGFALRRHAAGALWLLYPLVVLGAITVTANHFFFDAFTGAVLAGVAAIIAHVVMSRVRPGHWAWRPLRPDSRSGSGAPAPAEA
jgi:PAP2 superfamily